MGIVLEDSQGRIVGIEVKAGATVGASDFKGLKILAEITKDRFLRGVVLYTRKEGIPYGYSLYALPIDSLWRMGGGVTIKQSSCRRFKTK